MCNVRQTMVKEKPMIWKTKLREAVQSMEISYIKIESIKNREIKVVPNTYAIKT